MTENLLLTLEEKTMVLLGDLEALRQEATRLRLENKTLKAEQLQFTKKLQDLVSVLDDATTQSLNIREADFA